VVSTKSRSKGVSQVISSLMIMFLLLTALTTYTIFLSKSFGLASKTVERSRKEASRSMENVVIKPEYQNNEPKYILAYEGLKPTLKYVLLKCGNETSIGSPEEYGLEFGKPIPQNLISEIERGCNIVLVSERGKVYNLGYQISQLEIVNEKLSEISNINEVVSVVNSVSQIMPFIGNTSLKVNPGRIYVIGSEGNVLYNLDIVGNLPIYDVLLKKKFTTPKGEFLGEYFGPLNGLNSEQLLLMSITTNHKTVFKLRIYGNTPDGQVTLGKGIYLVYLTGEAYEGHWHWWYGVSGEGARVYVDIYHGGRRIGYRILDGANRQEYYYRGLRLNEWSDQFDGIFALIVLEGQVTLKYWIETEPTTWYMHHSFVIEKIADIGGSGSLKIFKHNNALYLEYQGHIFNVVYTSGNAGGKLYELGSYIIAPIGYVIDGIVSKGEPVEVSPEEKTLTYFEPLTFKPILNPMLLGIEKRYVYVCIESGYSFYEQTWGDFLDQANGLNLKIHFRYTEAIGYIVAYTTTSAIIPSNHYITVNILKDQSSTAGTLTIAFNGRNVFTTSLPTTPRNYLVKIGGDNVEYGQLTIKLTPKYIYPNNNVKVNINF